MSSREFPFIASCAKRVARYAPVHGYLSAFFLLAVLLQALILTEVVFAQASQPTITSPSDGHFTNDTTPTVTGTGPIGATIEVREGTTVLGTTIVDLNGEWSVTLSALPTGAHPLQAYTIGTPGVADAVLEYVDSGAGPMAGPYGGTSPGGPGFPITVDIGVILGTDPGPTGFNDFLSLPTGSYVSVLLTDEAMTNGAGDDLCITEVGASGEEALVEVSASDDNTGWVTLGTAIDDVSTCLNMDSLPDPGIAVKSIRVTGLDSFGGSAGFDVVNFQISTTAITSDPSDPSDPITINIDTTAPSAPVISVPTAGQLFATSNPTYSGTAGEVGATITVRNTSTSATLCTATVLADLSWSCTSVALADGSYTIDSIATDSAGNSSSASSTVTFTVNGPPVITNFTSTTADGTYGPGSTINIRATYSETITSGTLVVVLSNGVSVTLNSVSGGTTLNGTYTVGATGSGQDSSDLSVATITSESVTNGTQTQTMSSVPASPNNLADLKALVIDTTAPTLAEVTAVTSPTSDQTPDYTYSTTEAGTAVFGGSCLSASTSPSAGNNTVTLDSNGAGGNLALGTYTNCTITVTDARGNASSALAISTFIIGTSSPGAISSGLAVWLKANLGTGVTTDGSTVTTWTDQSGTGNSPTQGTAGSRPTYQSGTTDTLNYNPVVRFDGTNDHFDFADSATTNTTNQYQKTYHIVFRTGADVTTKQMLFENGSNNKGLNIYIRNGSLYWAAWNTTSDGTGAPWTIKSVNTALSTNTNYIASFVLNGNSTITGTGSCYLNGVLIGSMSNVGRIYFDGRNSALGAEQDRTRYDDTGSSTTDGKYINGDIAEFIYYNAVANSSSDINRVESYLAIKYGLTLSQTTAQNYVNSAGTVIYHATTAAASGGHDEYDNDIAGIARDDSSALNQSQSRSVNSDSIFTIYGASSLQHLDSLLWGNDNGAVGAWTSTDAPTGWQRISREWRWDETGDVGTVTVDVSDASLPALTSPSSRYVLLVDSDGDFTSGASGFLLTDLGTGTLRATGVEPGGDRFFTIAHPTTITPVITVNTLVTNDTRPALTGNITDYLAFISPATIQVTVNSTVYSATNNGNGTWTLVDNAISPALAQGTYSVTAKATNVIGVFGQDATSNELQIDTTAPSVTVDSLSTTDSTPSLTGTVNDNSASISVTVNGNTYAATNNGDGTWTLADNTISPALADGTYNVAASATDLAGNIGTDSTTNELVVITTPPTVTLSVTPSSIAEASGSATYTATLSYTYPLPVTVNLSYSGSATGGGTDYTTTGNSIVIAAGSLTGSVTVTAVQDSLDETNETVVVDISTVTNGTESGTQTASTSITDDDAAPTVTLSRDNATIVETTSGVATFTATLSAVSGQNVTVNLALSGTATGSGTDYTASGTSITINAGSTTGAITVTAAADTLDETNETVVVDISTVTNGTESGTQTASTSITDDDAAPTVTLSRDNATIVETTSGVATFTATLSAVSGQNVTVNLALSGTATGSGTDYTASGTSITINAGSTTGAITVTAAADTLDETNETVVVDISTVTNGTESGTQTASTSITDDDAAPTVTLSRDNATIVETTSGIATFTATLSAVSGQNVTVNLALSGTATGSGTDYTASGTSITINAGSTTGAITVTAAADTLDETNETVVVDISTVTNGTESGTQTASTSITDDDAAPTVTLSRDNATIVETTSGIATFTATLSAVSGQNVTVNLALSGTATGSGTDYTASGTSITINAGSTTGAITVTAAADTLDETDETVVVDISTVTNGTESGTQTASTSITDDDAAPTVTLSRDNATIVETTSGVATFTATLSAVSGQNVTVNLALSGTATGSGTDYTASGTSITINAGSTTGAITVTAAADTLDETNETVVVDISTVTNGTESGTQTASTSITDDDAAPTVTLSRDNATIVETTSGIATFTATLSAVSGQNVTVNLALSGTATGSGTDYTASGTSITINAGSTTGAITVTAAADTLDETNETVVVDISTVTNGTESGTQTASTSITDDDAAPTVTLSRDNATIVETTSGIATFTATLSAVSGQNVTVNLALSGTATGSGTDYTASGTSITINAGSTTGAITVTAAADTLDETDETVVVDISTVTNGTESGAQTASTSITDDDAAPTVTLSRDNATIVETTSGVATFTATLSAVSGQNVTVNLALSGTATGSGTDYTASGTSITINAGSTTGAITVTAAADTLDETDETVVVDISTVTNGTESGTQTASTSITDDDAAPTVTLSRDNATIVETTSGIATFTATLSAVSGQNVTVNLALSGTATGSGTDYTASGTSITINAGSTTGAITVTAAADTLDETNETVVVDISTVTNGTESGTQTASTSITDDDAAPTVTLSRDNATIVETTSGVATFTATLSAVSGQNVTVNLALSGTATGSGTDYTASGTSITINAGSTTGAITVTAAADTLDETNETVVVDISTVTNGTESGTQTASTSITDDDAAPTVTLSRDNATIVETTSGIATFTATLSAVSGQNVTVNLALSGTATGSGTDYTASGTSITINAGSTTGAITVTAAADTLDETNETVVVDISTVTNGTESGTQTASTSITDDDAAPTVTLSVDSASISETGGVATFTATLSAVSGLPVTVDLVYSGTAGVADYTESDTSIVISAGSTTGIITVSADADSIDEANETVVVDISSVTNGTESGTQQQTTTITDDDAAPTVTLSRDNATIVETTSGVATFTATLSAVSGRDVTVNLALSGTATGSGTDYTASGTSITINAGSTTGAITVTAAADGIDESDETVVVDILNVTNGTESGIQSVTTTILDDDDSPLAPIVTAPSNGAVLSDNTPTIAGTALAGGTVAVYDGVTLLGTAIVDGSGNWTFTPGSSLADGGHTITATVADGFGNLSPSSTPVSITIDTAVPSAPTITSPADGTIINDNTPTFTGTAEANSTVSIYSGVTLLGTATANGSGAWTFTPGTGLADGDYEITATATDAAGNVSAASGITDITVDTSVPASPTITAPADGTITNDNTPTFTGTAEANSTVSIYGGVTLLGTATANGSGAWTFTPGTGLADGDYEITATATDAAGNVSAASSITDITVDTSAPVSPTIASPADGTITNDNTPTFTGTAEANSTVSIYSGVTLLGTATANGSGAWTFTPGTGLADGDHEITATATDAAGNVSAASGITDITVDTSAPVSPTITAPADGTITNDNTPTFTGTAEANSTVSIYSGVTLLGTATANGSGAWTFTPGTGLADGDHEITATATDAAGNVSAASGITDITVDTSAPAAPTITSPAGGTITNDNTPTFTGTAEANSTVSIYSGVILLGTATANGSGAWSFTPGTGLADGDHEITATATDAAGNVSAASGITDITVDTSAPASPTITAPADGTITNDNTPTFTGTAEANSTVSVYSGVTLLGTTTANGSGAWTFTPGTGLADGDHEITATATDAAGNVSSASGITDITVDTSVPVSPTITAPADGTITNDNTPTFTGTAEANSTVSIYSGVTLLGTTTANGSGAWTFTPGTGLADGDHEITAIATDAAGNVSAASSITDITVDTSAPAAPTITSPADGTITNDNTPTFAGTAEANSTVSIYSGVTLLGTATANGSGAWTFTPATGLADGDHEITATAADAAGNVSTASSITDITVDTSAPSAPTITAPVDGTITNDNTPTFTGTAEANSTVSIYSGVTLLGTATANGSGAWTFTPGTGLADGDHEITVTATDAAGNVSSVSGITDITVDTSAPASPTITTPADGTITNDNTPTFTGTAEANSTVSIYSGVTLLGTATANGSGAWTFTPGTGLADGDHEITATATDAAGNVSAASGITDITVDTSVPVSPTITAPADGTITNDNTPTFTGTAEANSIVSIYSGVTLLGIATANGSGAWTFTPGTGLADGDHEITAIATDAAGNVSAASGITDITVDTSAPVSPTITSPADGTITNDNTPTFTGTAEANSTVSIYSGVTLLGTATVNGSGAWTFTPGTGLADGDHEITATATDAAGNVSASSGITDITVDTSAPVSPTITSPADGTITNDNTPTFTGTAEANSIVSIYSGVTLLGTAAANGSGAWTFTPGTGLADGDHEITATATDAAGNVSAASGITDITVDTSAPSAPIITAPVDGTITNDNTPTFTGTAEANSTVSIYSGVTLLGTATANGSGAWTFTPGTGLADGDHEITATATDAAGSISAASGITDITVDTSAPASPTITAPADGTITNDNTPTFTGTAEANSTVSIYSGATLLGTATANGSGAWSFTPGTGLADGDHEITAIATDAAGNVSAASGITDITVDTSAPSAPTITSPVDGTITNDNTPTFTGTAEANSTVSIYSGVTLLGTTTANGSGAWTFTPGTGLADGDHEITATATDAAGNVSAASLITDVTVDTSAPSAPTITAPADETTTNDNTPTFTGNAEANSTVSIYSGVTLLGTATANSSGAWTFTPVTELADGDHEITATATDVAGNVSLASSITDITVETSAPAAPTITAPTDGTVTNDNTPTFTGNAEANSTVSVYSGAILLGTATTNGSGVWTFTPGTGFADGDYEITATATDAAANVSAPSSITDITIDTSVPSAPTITAPVDGTLTNDNTPTFSGTAEANSTVSIYSGVTLLGTATANGSGAWTFTPGTGLTDGDHEITATATDAAGNVSPASSITDITVDTSAPLAPTITAPADGTLTNDNTPTFTGTAEANSTVSVYSGSTLIGTAIANGSGAWTFTPGTGLADGDHEITATSTDAAGNVSAVSGITDISVDTSVPSAPTITAPADGTLTNDNTPTFIGTAEANSVVSIYNGITLLGTATANGSGAWTFTPGTGLTDGDHEITATATDAAGNVSPESSITDITVDTSVPLAPTITAPADGTLTNDNTPTFTGTAEANSTVSIYSGITLLGTATANGSGAWSFTPGTGLVDGDHEITATATDSAGNISSASSITDITVDTSAPLAPTITAPADGTQTNDNTPTFTGTAEANSTVSIYSGITLLGTATANGSGAWTFTPGTGLAEGDHEITATATDAAGNVSPASSITDITVDTSAPLAPTITAPADGTLTNDNTPTFTGTAEANSTVSVYSGITLLGTATANGSGAWTFTPGTGLAEGDHEITATATDAAGNVSPASSITDITVDTSVPLVPTITTPADGTLTNDNTPTFTGTAEANSTVSIYSGTTLLGTAAANGSGAWTFTPGTGLADGDHAITATATDAAGNVSGVSTTTDITVDTSAPAAPEITSPADGTVTNDNTPTFVGTVEANSTVSIYSGTTLLGTTTANGSGAWTLISGTGLADGYYLITATATDEVGNTGASSDAVLLTIDTVAPAAPIISAPLDSADINDNTPLISGTGEANSTIRVYDGVSLIGTVTADGSGNWSFTPSPALVDGSHSFTATATDAAGNTGPASSVTDVTVDTSVPGAPTILVPSDGTVTNDNTPSISGSAEANSTVSIYDGLTLLGTALADGSGVWTYVPSPALIDGLHSLTATATDAAGNVSSASPATEITVDTSAPLAPVISAPADGTFTNDTTPTISGTAEANSTVSIYDGVTLLGTATADAFGAWSFTPSPALAEGSHSFTAVAEDGAGNISPVSNEVTVTIDTTLPTAPVISSPVTGSITNDNTPTISGTAEANSVIAVYDGTTLIGTTTTNGSGAWTFTPSTGLSNGSHTFKARSTDAAGNVSSDSNSVSITIDTTVPVAPVITAPANGLKTNNATPVVSGSAEANSTVRVFDGTTLLGTTTANGSGAWSFTPSTPLANGSHTFTATSTDAAGNTSVASNARTITVDTIAPSVPIITSPTNGATLSTTTPTFTGTAEANSIVEIFVDGLQVGSTTANSSGAWSYTSSALAGGAHTLAVRGQDAAGNFSATSSTRTFTVATDVDGDGLDAAEEALYGTDPNLADTDNDGVSDGDEVDDGSAPLDRGSNIPVLPKTICSTWNGFLGDPGFSMWNIMEHVNMSNSTLNIRTTLYNINGVAQSVVNFAIAPGAQFDVLVHDMVGWIRNSYGQVCSEVLNSGALPGDLDGRMSFYKALEPVSNRYEFAFAIPFADGVKDRQYVLFNTFQVSSVPSDASNLVANWIQITNQEATTQTGTVYFYNQAGTVIGSQNMTLNGRARRDISAHQYGANNAGMVEWRPTNTNAKFNMINAVYRYNNPAGTNIFDSAYQFDGAIGNGQILSVPIETSGATAVLEVGNTKSTSIVVDVSVRNLSGTQLQAYVLNLAPHASTHLLMNPLLNGQRGIATISVRGQTVDSVIAFAMEYGKTAAGAVQYFYGVQSKQSLGAVLRSSYNTYLNQTCSVLLTNPTSSSRTATISMKRYDGTNVLSGQSITIPALGGAVFDACSRDQANVYGVVTVMPTTVNTVFGSVLRKGNLNDYHFPTPLRQ